MIKRYSTREMDSIWNDEYKIQIWFRIEKELLKEVCDNFIEEELICPSLEEIEEGEKITHHDVGSFVERMIEKNPKYSNYIHYGLTSSDLLDTTNTIRIANSVDILIVDLWCLINLLEEESQEYKDYFCLAKTHGMPAEIITFGLRMLGWYEELKESYFKLKKLNCFCGKLSGTIGTYTQLNPDIEKRVLKKFKIKPCNFSTQIVSRDMYCDLIYSLISITNCFERISTNLRLLQMEGEVREGFKDGQIGSSAMPHKNNPIDSENLCGISRLMRGYLQSILESNSLWLERDISHSSVERVMLPDAFNLTHFSIKRMTNIIENLEVKKEKMLENIENTKGLIYSQSIMSYLAKKGFARNEIYKWIQKLCKEVMDEKVDNLHDALLYDDKTFDYFEKFEEIKELMKKENYIKHMDYIFKRVVE